MNLTQTELLKKDIVKEATKTKLASFKELCIYGKILNDQYVELNIYDFNAYQIKF